ncbi:hypothetical protein C8R43DRAFT_39037 [Mycena crocata]|nr:hypothetical protein C8R43DRAFT_39037 [Mycena crocata]
MHPALSQEHVSKLPISIRRFATPAANGSLPDLLRILDLLTHPSRSVSDRIVDSHVLPVFYANLEPSSISEAETLSDDAVRRAFLAINGLHALSAFPAGCGVDLWPRLWTWISFIHSNREGLGLLGVPTEVEVCLDLLHLVDHLTSDANVAKLIEQTVGLRSLITRSWFLLLRAGGGPDQEGYIAVDKFLSLHMKASEPANLAEMMDGAGGRRALAALVTRHIDLCFPRGTKRASQKNLHALDGVLELLADLDDGAGPMKRALASSGIVISLTCAALAIAESRIPGIVQLVLALLSTIHSFFQPVPCYRAIGNALTARLLRVIARCAAMGGPADENDTSMWYMLRVVLPSASVYHSVAIELEPAFHDVADLTETAAFRRLPIWKTWDTFHTLAKKRIKVLRDIETRGLLELSFKACDNMHCGIIDRKSEFARCGRCQRAYYCSEECQTLDWKSGGHHQACGSIRAQWLAAPEFINGVNRCFMRALVQHDAQEVRLETLIQQFNMMRRHPESEMLVTVLQYAPRGELVAAVSTVAEQRARDRRKDVKWDEYVARAAHSGGRMQLYLMVVVDGETERRRMFASRSDSSDLQDGLRGLVRELPPGVDPEHAQQKIRELMRGQEGGEVDIFV